MLFTVGDDAKGEKRLAKVHVRLQTADASSTFEKFFLINFRG